LAVVGHLRSRRRQFDLRVYSVDFCVLHFQSFVDCRECSFQLLNFLVFFQELVECERMKKV
jgi:hypothetical protein